MAKGLGLFQWSCAAALMALAATPVVAKDSRTLWLCSENGCVQVERSDFRLIETNAVMVPKTHRAPAVVHPVAASAPRVPVDELIDMSLVTGVFQ